METLTTSNNYEYIVSVCIITYNQEDYIATCLESVINQDINLPYQIIIADDNSTDNTRIIINEFKDKYPYLIHTIFQDRNVGTVKNLLSAYNYATGKYIAHMDGDDYAYPQKLLKQIEALESNPECIICTHNVNIVDKEQRIIKNSFYDLNTGTYDAMFLYSCLPFFSHSSKMFVNNFDKLFWEKFNDHSLDIEVHMAQLEENENSFIYHINEKLGAYRYFTGVSAIKNNVNPSIVEGNIRIFTSALKNNNYNKNEIKIFFAKSILNYAYQSAVLGNKKDFHKYITYSMSIKKISLTQRFFYILRNRPCLILYLCKLRSTLRGYKH